jgi:hypothetical protein
MQPLAVGNGIKLFQGTSHPFARFLVGVDLVKVSGLNHTPLFGRKSEKEVGSANQSLGKNSITDLGGQQQWEVPRSGWQKFFKRWRIAIWRSGWVSSSVKQVSRAAMLAFHGSSASSAQQTCTCCAVLGWSHRGQRLWDCFFQSWRVAFTPQFSEACLGIRRRSQSFRNPKKSLHAFQSILVMAVGGVWRGWL